LISLKVKINDQSYIAGTCITFPKGHFGNMNSQTAHQAVFLDETWAFTNGSDYKMRSNGTSQSAIKEKKPTPSTRYIIVTAVTKNRFVSGVSLIFVSGAKSDDYIFNEWGEF